MIVAKNSPNPEVNTSGDRWSTRLLRMLAGVLLCARPVVAAVVPAGFQDIPIAQGFTSPTTLTALPDGRVLVLQQNGIIRMIKNDSLLSTPFWNVPNADSSFECGCLGITSDPNFSANHYIYVYCTTNPGPANRVFRATEANDVVVSGSVRTIFTLPNLPGSTRWHMGGALRFALDGKLHVAVGNHEDTPRNPSNAQNLSNPFGKILRINPNGTVPSDNPYFSVPGAYQAIYAHGFRNPFAFDINPVNGRMFVGDVGQSAWEEVDEGLRGANYGWPYFEGNSQRISPPSGFNHTPPLYTYSHSEGCSVTGVAAYNPPNPQFPSQYHGKVFYEEYCHGYMRVLDPNTRVVSDFATGMRNPTNMVVAPNGALYYVEHGRGLSKIVYTGSQPPRISQHPHSLTVALGARATFTVTAEGATSYQWLRNGGDIAGATSTTYSIASTTLQDNGARFSVRVNKASGGVTSNEATLTVSTNAFPVARIDLPVPNLQSTPGQIIAFAGGAADAENGTLSGDALTWQIDYHHDQHASGVDHHR